MPSPALLPTSSCWEAAPEDLSQDLPSRGLFPDRLMGVTVLAGTLCALLLQPQQLPAVGITWQLCAGQGMPPAPLRLTQLPGPGRKAKSCSSAFPPLWQQKSSDCESSEPAGLSLQPLSALQGSLSLSLCVSQGRGGWGRSQSDSHMLGVTGAGQCPAVTQPCLQ